MRFLDCNVRSLNEHVGPDRQFRKLTKTTISIGSLTKTVERTVSTSGFHFTGIAFVSVGADMRKFHHVFTDFFRFPAVLVPASGSTVQMVWPVVSNQIVLFPVQTELPRSSSISDSPNDTPEKSRFFMVLFDAIKAGDNVVKLTVGVFCFEFLNNAAVVQNVDFNIWVFESVDQHVFVEFRSAPGSHFFGLLFLVFELLKLH